MKNLEINFLTLSVILNNDTITLKKDNDIKEVVDSRLATDLKNYISLNNTINSNITKLKNRNKENNKTRFIFILINLLSLGVISLTAFNKLYYLLLFGVIPLSVTSTSIKELTIDNQCNNKDINSLKELKLELDDVKSMLELNILERFCNEDDFKHYVVYTENCINDISSKIMIK